MPECQACSRREKANHTTSINIATRAGQRQPSTVDVDSQHSSFRDFLISVYMMSRTPTFFTLFNGEVGPTH
jgi:hypothetical protein